jgi:CheY-like chemotaxis protein
VVANTIVLAEDDVDVRETVSYLLEERGFDVVQTANGKECLEQLRTCDPGLVLLDLMMPVMSGWQVLDALREDPRLAALPVVVISAVASLTAVPMGATTLLKKPISMESLLRAIEDNRLKA